MKLPSILTRTKRNISKRPVLDSDLPLRKEITWKVGEMALNSFSCMRFDSCATQGNGAASIAAYAICIAQRLGYSSGK